MYSYRNFQKYKLISTGPVCTRHINYILCYSIPHIRINCYVILFKYTLKNVKTKVHRYSILT